MSNIKCSPEDFSDALFGELNNYSEEIAVGVKKSSDIVIKEVNAIIKEKIPFTERTGKYLKAFRTKTTNETKYNKENTWYVGDNQWGLTHLLEDGHALPQGGRSEAYPHIVYGEEIAEERMSELVEEVVKNAGR